MKPKYPLISIITPSFNQGRFLEETIRSVLLQDYPAVEYIIVDGGSTDNSPAIIEKYKSRLGLAISEPDRGQADAVNKGLEQASGEFVGWLNSDDIYTENAVSSAVEKLRANPELGMVYSNVLSIDSESTVFNTMLFGDWGLKELLRFNIIGQPGAFMRKKAVEDAGYLDQDFHYMLDHHLWLRIALKYPISYADEFWAAARFHSSAKNIAYPSGFGEEAMRILEWMEEHPDFQPHYQSDKRKIKSGAYLFKARYLLDGGENWNAFKSYIQGIALDFSSFPKIFNRMAYSFLNGLIPLEKKKREFIQKRSELIKKRNYDNLFDYLQNVKKE